MSKIFGFCKKYLFSAYSKWRQIKENVLWLNKCLLSDLWLLSSANPLKSTEESVICAEKHVFIQKRFKIGLIWVCHYKLGSKSHFFFFFFFVSVSLFNDIWPFKKEQKHSHPPLKRKFKAQKVNKKVIETVFRYMKGSISIDFPQKVEIINNACNWWHLKQNSTNSLNDPHSFFHFFFFQIITFLF